MNDKRNVTHAAVFSDDFMARLVAFEASPDDEARIRKERLVAEEQARQKAMLRRQAKLEDAGFGSREIKAAMQFQHPRFDEVMAVLRCGGLAFVHGDCGAGKTVLACRCALQWDAGRVVYKRAVEFFLDIKDCWHHKAEQSEKAYLAGLRKAGLLVIDELQDRSLDSHWEDGLLTAVVDFRYSHELPTLVLSNRAYEEVKEASTRSIVSRAQQVGRFIELRNSSFRRPAR